MKISGLQRRALNWALVGAMLIWGGRPAEAAGPPPKPPGDPFMVSAKFGFKLFSELARKEANRNLFISPTSVAAALAMAVNGAEGETRAALAKGLEAQGASIEEINRCYSALLQTLKNPDPKVQVNVADSLWIRQGLKVKPAFINVLQGVYAAKVATLDFSAPKAADIINGWVKEQTRGEISEIVKQIDPQTVLLLINAIYFKGKWQNVFDEGKTRPAPFYLASGQPKNVPMMSQSGNYKYFHGDGFQAVGLPYGEGRTSMVIVLPDKNLDWKNFLGKLNVENWNNWTAQLQAKEGEIRLPRFKLAYEAELNQPLKALGMEVAFNPERANFGKMIAPPAKAFISQVKHKAFVKVNEEGTEAAAATSVQIGLTAAREKFRMTMDRPFFCAIRDNQSGVILFMGLIINPAE